MAPKHGEQVECSQADKIEKIGRDLGELDKIVFRGNGKPSLVSQMAVIDSKISALCWIVAVTCGAVIAQIVAMIFKVKVGS